MPAALISICENTNTPYACQACQCINEDGSISTLHQQDPQSANLPPKTGATMSKQRQLLYPQSPRYVRLPPTTRPISSHIRSYHQQEPAIPLTRTGCNRAHCMSAYHQWSDQQHQIRPPYHHWWEQMQTKQPSHYTKKVHYMSAWPHWQNQHQVRRTRICSMWVICHHQQM